MINEMVKRVNEGLLNKSTCAILSFPCFNKVTRLKVLKNGEKLSDNHKFFGISSQK